MSNRVRLTGDAGRIVPGTRLVMPISEAETVEMAVIGYDEKTGGNLCEAPDGRKYRAFQYGYTEPYVCLLPRQIRVYPDHGPRIQIV